MEITLDNIRTDVDYDEFLFFESHLTHELHRMSEEEFIEKYGDLDEWCDTYEKRALLASILRYVGYKGELEFTPKGIILDYLDYYIYKEEEEELSEDYLKECYENSIEEFRQNGILYEEFGGFADGTYYKPPKH